jgi:hypothetical protein
VTRWRNFRRVRAHATAFTSRTGRRGRRD